MKILSDKQEGARLVASIVLIEQKPGAVRLGVYSGSLNVELRRTVEARVREASNPKTVTDAIMWERGVTFTGYPRDAVKSKLREMLTDMFSEFTSDYYKQNPER